MSGFQDAPSVAYYQVEDFSVFDNEDDFFDLCAELNFEPFAPVESNDSSSEVESVRLNHPISRKRGGEVEEDSSSQAVPTGLVFPQQEGERKRKKKVYAPIAVEKRFAHAPVTVEHANERNHNTSIIEETDDIDFAALLPKDDIRRTITGIFFDVLNQVEGTMSMAQYMSEHVTEDAFFSMKYIGNIPQHFFAPYLEVIGRESWLKFMLTFLDACPDGFFEVHDTNIKVLMNGFTSITVKYSYTGTKVLDLVTDSHASAVIIADNSKSDGKGGHSVYAFELEEGTNRVLDRPPVENNLVVGVRKQIERFSTVATNTFHVNPDKRIYKAELLHCMKSLEVS